MHIVFYPEETWDYDSFKNWVRNKIVVDLPDTQS